MDCRCGDSLQGIVECNPITFRLKVLRCYCITYSELLNTTVVGYCLTTCPSPPTRSVIHIKNTNDLDSRMCGGLHRQGQMCGRCEEGYAPPVYSYSLSCVECSDYKYNWLKYITVAFLPLTLFYIVILVFRLNAFSGSINATIIVCQLLTISMLLRFCQLTASDMPTASAVIMQIFMTLYSIWNLDFLRTVYKPFCLHPKLTTLQAFAMDYIVAVYPLVLIMLTYLCVMLHDRYRLVIWLWSPFHRCLSHFRKEWYIRRSLVDVFATFILLSYVKILDISFNILTPTALWSVNGTEVKESFLYIDGSVKYFQGSHLLFGVLAIGMVCVFNVLPLILLALYPSKCFQKCLNHCHGCQFQFLKVFMDTFQGGFKTEPYDCRYFAAFYLFLRFVNLTTMGWTRTGIYFSFSGLLLGFASLTVALVRPWAVWWHNVLDSIVLASLCVLGVIFYTVDVSPTSVDPKYVVSGKFRGASAIFAVVPGIVGAALVTQYIVPKAALRYCKQKIRAVTMLFKKVCVVPRESIPTGEDENTPLISCVKT